MLSHREKENESHCQGHGDNKNEAHTLWESPRHPPTRIHELNSKAQIFTRGASRERNTSQRAYTGEGKACRTVTRGFEACVWV